MNKLNIIIVGSGLAGLTAARILREHHNVKVYERGDASTATGGQGIMIAPNGVRILESIGYNQNFAGAVPILGFRTYGKDGAVKEDIDGSLAQMVFNPPVVALDPEEGIVTLEDGSIDSADVLPTEYTLDYAKLFFVKTAMRRERRDSHAIALLSQLKMPGRLLMDYRSRTVYPLSRQSFFNLSCIAKVNPSSKTGVESWHADADLDQLVDLFSDFHEPLRRIMSASTEVKVWELQDLDSLPTWTRGRTIIIGDAAHAMTPMQGQGANMGIEGAESLRLLAPGTLRQDVPGILKLAESVRKPRVDFIGDT
ncbi:unnamed protein product [Clonostachys rhizophaga]|uniref:FAD-binding domain-containing protein n=1 Tax=Clonostachys rhizophaga TaxID=160324 RepID=A0A9N9VMG0_9HYPO|nr:unnamed protein product [Clonostachys rhizophaga]